MKHVSVLWRVVWNASVSFFTAVSATSHRRKVTTDYLILLVLSERYVSKTLKQCTRPQGHVHYSPANPVERSFAFQSIHKNTTRLWSLKSVHSSLATFKVAFKEDKRHSLPSHRNTGIFRARHSHQRSASPTPAQPRWERRNKAHKQNGGASPKRVGGQAPPGGGSGQSAVLSSCAAVSSEGDIQGKAGPAEAFAGEGRRSREQPSTLHRTGFREKMKTCPQITKQNFLTKHSEPPPHPRFTVTKGHDLYQEREAACWAAAIHGRVPLAWHQPFGWQRPPRLREAQTPLSNEKRN